MRVSVILSTYNALAWLEKSLWGFATQTCRPQEVVVADDGSTDETRLTIERVRRETGLRIEHVWHEDRGFRKCEILNKAIAAASGEYLLFTDGDCIPRRDFVTVHLRYARPGRFLSGGIVRLPLGLSELISIEDIIAGRATSTTWLVRHGLPLSKKCLLMAASAPAVLLDHITPTQPTWNGHNASGWKADLVRVNGFDERMGWGGEDRELGERLENAGVRGKQIRHRAACVHLDHGRAYVNPQIIAWNRRHRQIVRRMRIAWSDHGIHKRAA